ncbi:PAS domain S-box protein [Phototrophicus methaneseepsis]|uniref:histidine kinase n=1 Tax=Phototrophicus methaneseepsis TaxID=2710758 RepID=A0A7S8IBM5_9CHLR|nr:PAS domain S-box protein [Phototrophicus methaneseepsis]QPC80610.1 PAS domain S-box protein [Phototrophicus methaneseepsis]
MSFVIELTNNITLLLSLLFVYGLLSSRILQMPSRQRQISQGLIFGVFAIIAMLIPFEITPGFIYDGRHVVIAMAAFFTGPIAGVISCIMVCLYRLTLGGIGAPLAVGGAFSVVIVALVMRKFMDERRLPVTAGSLLILGLLEAGVSIFWPSLSPAPIRQQILDTIAIPVITLFPMAILLAGWIFQYIERQELVAKSLRNNAEWFQTISELLPVPLLLYRSDDNAVLYVNEKFCQFYGATSEELLDRPMSTLFCGFDSFDKVQEKLQAEGLVRNFEVRGHRRLDGQVFWSLLTIEPIMFRGASVMLTIFVDITERKQVEEALRQSDRSLQQAQAIGHVGSWELDLETDKTAWSDEFFRICGLEPGSVEPSTELRLSMVHPDDRPLAVAELERVHQEGKSYYIEKRIVRPNNEIRWVLSQGEIVYDAETSSKKLIGMFIDITQRKQMENRFRALLESAPDAMVIVDQNGCIEIVNSQAEHMFGYTREELIGHEVAFLIPESLRSRSLDNRVAYLKQPYIRTLGAELDLYATHKDGHRFPVEIRLSPIETEKGLLVAGAVRDVSERRERETQLKRMNSDLEQANREIQHFAYIVSHDLRAPLINLKGFSDILNSSLDQITAMNDVVMPVMDEQQVKTWNNITKDRVPTALRFISLSVDRMDSYTSAILKLSRLGRHELNIKRVVTNDIVQKIVESLDSQMKEQNIQVEIDDLPDVYADQLTLDQIFANIIGNAVKYASPDREEMIRIYAEDSLDQTTFHIQDNGRGIAEADYDKVFAPFRRIGKSSVEGEGMGLAYVQAMVRRHGGEIWFTSSVETGSIFSFRLPKELT